MSGLAPEYAQLLRRGVVIPAHPLALTADRKLDVRHQRGLTRYYCAAGAGGIAVGVHTTQFEIHDPASGLLPQVLALASKTADEMLAGSNQPLIKIAGLVGSTRQVIDEAHLALDHGYHAGLLSLGALRHATDQELLAHVAAVAAVIPIMGFYLQPAVGGRVLGYDFWRCMVEIDNVVAIKVAPFNRYQTLDVVRAVAEAGRSQEIALYTGNDDSIVTDLITEYVFAADGPAAGNHFVGGLLGQWAVWTQQAVTLLAQIQQQRATQQFDHARWLTYGAQLTDANAAIFDPSHNFHGCIPGIHWILQRQGLMQGTWTLNPAEGLSPGQAAELSRVCAAYPHLTDDEFVATHRQAWLD